MHTISDEERSALELPTLPTGEANQRIGDVPFRIYQQGFMVGAVFGAALTVLLFCVLVYLRKDVAA